MLYETDSIHCSFHHSTLGREMDNLVQVPVQHLLAQLHTESDGQWVVKPEPLTCWWFARRRPKDLDTIPPVKSPSTGNVKFPCKEMSFKVSTFLALERSMINFLQDSFFIVYKNKVFIIHVLIWPYFLYHGAMSVQSANFSNQTKSDCSSNWLM